jgi:predicted anti-sigma-YlaC factor YlaD
MVGQEDPLSGAMDHQQAQSSFSDYLDGTLAARDKGDLDQHLAACIQCRTELAALREALGSLGKLKQPAPPDFLPGIQQQINRRSRGRFFAQRWKLFGRIPFEWVSLIMIIAMLIYYLALMYGQPTAVRPAP